MRKLNALAIMAVSFLAFSCGEKNIVQQEPQAPAIERVSLKGVSGEDAVVAGENVLFTAAVSAGSSTLGTYSVQIRKGTELIASAEGTLDGEAAAIEKEMALSVNPAEISGDFMPEVTFKVTNTDGMFTERMLSESENVTVKAPESFERLYLVDNNGNVVEMEPASVPGRYRTAGSLENIGTSFSVSSSVTADGKADGKIWDGILTPDSGEYGLVWIAFDTFTGSVSKMVDHTEVFDYSDMAQDAADGYKVYWARRLVNDCRCEFVNFPDGLRLQGDRFDDVEGNTARYTGPTFSSECLEVYHIAKDNWFVIKYQWNVGDAMWLTGTNASLPMEPYCSGTSLDWFANSPNGVCATSTISFMKTGADRWRALVYLKSNFELRIYSGWGWAFEVLPLKSATPGLLTVTPLEADEDGKTSGNLSVPGADFEEGLYMLELDSMSNELSLVKYSEAYLPVIAK